MSTKICNNIGKKIGFKTGNLICKHCPERSPEEATKLPGDMGTKQQPGRQKGRIQLFNAYS
jgi:hypothetical protein